MKLKAEDQHDIQVACTLIQYMGYRKEHANEWEDSTSTSAEDRRDGLGIQRLSAGVRSSARYIFPGVDVSIREVSVLQRPAARKRGKRVKLNRWLQSYGDETGESFSGRACRA